jgi:hypothetical protein
MANKKISQLIAKGSALAATDLVEIAEDAGGGTYVTKSVTGANIKSGLQATLVSGTNIKTINSTTLLGSGDIVLGSGVHVLTKPVTGRTYSVRTDSQSATATLATVGNFIYLSPFVPANTLTVSNLQINVTTLTVGGNARILVYSDVAGVPTTKLLESSLNLDCSTIGTKTSTPATPFTFTAGTTYWLGLYSNLAVTLSAVNPTQLIPISTSLFTGGFSTMIAAATFGSAPTTLSTAILNTASINMYAINLTAQ